MSATAQVSSGPWGRVAVATVVAGVLAIALATTSLKEQPIGAGIFRLLLTVILLVFLYRGHAWARVLTIVLLMAALAVIVHVAVGSYSSTITWVRAAFYLMAIYTLVWFRPARDFLKSQREVRSDAT
jgi:hypothetical protein